MSGPGSPLWPKIGFPPGGGGGGGFSGLIIEQGGVPLPGTFTTLNFTGGFTVTPTVDGADITLNVAVEFGPGAGLVQAVATDPPGGWTVLSPGAFVFENDATDPFDSATFQVVALVSNTALVGSIRLFDVTDGVPVATSVLTTSSGTDVVLTTGDILGDLIDGHLYQFQAEATGGSASTDVVVVRSALLIAEF